MNFIIMHLVVACVVYNFIVVKKNKNPNKIKPNLALI